MEASAVTKEFCRETINGKGSSLYTTTRFVDECFHAINNERLGDLIVDFIQRRKPLMNELSELYPEFNKTKYFNEMKRGNSKGDSVQLQAIAMTIKLAIHQVSFHITDDGFTITKVICYDTHVESFTECVYLLYNEDKQQYEALYVPNSNKENGRQTIFEHKDENIFHLVYKFIEEKLEDKTFVPSADTFSCKHLKPEIGDSDEAHGIVEKVTLNALNNQLIKRKIPNHDELQFGETPDILDVTEPSKKIFKPDPKETSSSNKNIDKSMDVEEKQIFQFKEDPKKTFDTRTPGDFLSKTKSETRSPRYFCDKNRGYFPKFKISQSCLSFDRFQYSIELRIVTDEINGYKFDHPYFQFGIFENNNQQIKFVDRINIDLNDKTKLTKIEEDLFELEHKIVVVKKTNSQLMTTKQPLDIFSKPEDVTGRSRITEKFSTSEDFKKAYNLDNLRFAAILKRKLRDQDEYQIFKQCISQISTRVNKGQKI